MIRPGEGRKSLSGSSELIRHSIAWPRVDDLVLAERQRLAGGDPDLLLDQVDAGDHLGDRVLDLDAGVDLDEVEVVVGVDQELAGAGVDVAGGSGQPDGGLAEPGADLQRQGRRGRLLDELLVPALERAVAVPAVDDVAVRVGEDLDLDVARAVDELLEVDAGVLERGLGLVAGRLERADEVGLVAADPHPLAAAAGRRLDQDGVADRAGEPQRLGVAGDRRRRSRARRRPWPRRRSAWPRSSGPSCGSPRAAGR